MVKVSKLFAVVVLIAGTVPTISAKDTKAEGVEKLQKATETLHEITGAPDKGIHEEVLEHAKCIAVVPNLTKAGFIVGGQHGSGVATCRLANGNWSAPVFMNISGGSWGAQIGVERVDLVMTIMNDNGMRELLKN